MKYAFHRPLGPIFMCAAAALALPPAARAQGSNGAESDLLGPGYWRIALSPFSHHFRYSVEHKYVWAVAVERQRNDNWLAGASYFRNSFGQPSAYLYVGKRFPALFDEPRLFAQASGGMLYGYRGKYKNKVPLNYNGFSPGALVSLGWQLDSKMEVTGHLLGDAGIMFQLSLDLP